MAKLRVLSAREVCRILEENGFVQVRQRGSHIIMQMQIEDSTITVPIPN
ncbi:type II toxin-antitoxin system HicA family toxin [Nostoc sp. C052]|nr:type II toxin-antitoxin system HicA family toxin [Nostoc sp. C052]QLE41514.1 type II toxin-antitoxin system HicA family toxin [Nostoc sp. C052]